jgi:hypothetical protein
MRLLLLVLSVALALLAASATAGATVDRTLGSVYVQFQRGAGSAKVRFTGNFFGTVNHGRIVATNNVNLSNCASRENLTDTLTVCRGDYINFRTLPGTRWRVRLVGRGIFTTGFVRGCMTLDGRDSGKVGFFKIGRNGDFRSWPRVARTYKLGQGC